MPIQSRETVTSREVQEHEWAKEMYEKQAEHAIRMKELEIKHLNLEAKITSWFRIPIVIIKLPVYLLFGVAYIVHAVRKIEPSESFWKFINR